MSKPITACQMIKAAKTEIFEPLRNRLDENIRFGSMTFLPCKCKSKCKMPTVAQVSVLFQEIPKLATILLSMSKWK